MPNNMTWRTLCGVLCLLCVVLAGNGQVACVTGASFPNPAVDRVLGSINAAADPYLAVSPLRMVLTTNEKLQLRCRSTGGKLLNLGSPTTLPLRGAALASGLFVTDPPELHQPRRMFDPRVIYDPYGQRFWLVASESGTGQQFFDAGRIHFAVSQDDVASPTGTTPNSWTGTHWIKCTFGGANKNPIDVANLAVVFNDPQYEGTIPDHCSIAVDAEYLYISYRELRPGVDAPASPTVILVTTKASFTGVGPIVVEAALRVDTGLALHEFARDYEIDPLEDAGVWVVSKGPKDGSDVYNNVRLGQVHKVGGVWSYSSWDLPLDALAYQGYCGPPNNPVSGMPGGRYRLQAPQPNNCVLWENDRNATFLDFGSCITRLDPNGVRKVWAVHAVRPAEAGDFDCPSSLQWYEIDPIAKTVATSRYTLPDGDYAHDPSIAVNANGDIVITFNRSYADPAKYPGVWRLTKPSNGSSFISEEKPGPPLVYRPMIDGSPRDLWADFSGTEPDPVDPCRFWAHHITVHNNPLDTCGFVSEQWRSWCFRYDLDPGDCSPAPFRGNLDMNEDGELNGDDIAIYDKLASAGDPEVDRTYDGKTDAWDLLDFLHEWDNAK